MIEKVIIAEVGSNGLEKMEYYPINSNIKHDIFLQLRGKKILRETHLSNATIFDFGKEVVAVGFYPQKMYTEIFQYLTDHKNKVFLDD